MVIQELFLIDILWKLCYVVAGQTNRWVINILKPYRIKYHIFLQFPQINCEVKLRSFILLALKFKFAIVLVQNVIANGEAKAQPRRIDLFIFLLKLSK